MENDRGEFADLAMSYLLEMSANLAVSLFQSYKLLISVQNMSHREIYGRFTHSELGVL